MNFQTNPTSGGLHSTPSTTLPTLTASTTDSPLIFDNQLFDPEFEAFLASQLILLPDSCVPTDDTSNISATSDLAPVIVSQPTASTTTEVNKDSDLLDLLLQDTWSGAIAIPQTQAPVSTGITLFPGDSFSSQQTHAQLAQPMPSSLSTSNFDSTLDDPFNAWLTLNPDTGYSSLASSPNGFSMPRTTKALSTLSIPLFPPSDLSTLLDLNIPSLQYPDAGNLIQLYKPVKEGHCGVNPHPPGLLNHTADDILIAPIVRSQNIASTGSKRKRPLDDETTIQTVDASEKEELPIPKRPKRKRKITDCAHYRPRNAFLMFRGFVSRLQNSVRPDGTRPSLPQTDPIPPRPSSSTRSRTTHKSTTATTATTVSGQAQRKVSVSCGVSWKSPCPDSCGIGGCANCRMRSLFVQASSYLKMRQAEIERFIEFPMTASNRSLESMPLEDSFNWQEFEQIYHESDLFAWYRDGQAFLDLKELKRVWMENEQAYEKNFENGARKRIAQERDMKNQHKQEKASQKAE